MSAYYNEIDPFAAQWLRNLIAAGHIAPGDVDERSIEDVRPDDLRGYTQCHFFAGIGVWSYALRRAGWPDDRPVWSASCPCQPFSAAGKGAGFADERHLWPAVDFLAGECRPAVLFGEQVASKDGLAWLDTVQADLEGKGYAVGALDLCAAGVGAPHIRQRLYFVAYSLADTARNGRDGPLRDYKREEVFEIVGGSGVGELADADGRNASAEGLQRGREHGQQQEDCCAGRLEHAESNGREQRIAVGGRDRERNSAERRHRRLAEPSILGHADDAGPQEQRRGSDEQPCAEGRKAAERSAGLPSVHGFWHACDWLPCIDGKARPVEPGTFPLAHGAAARVGRLRGYGNAIVAPLAEEFIRAYLSR